MDQVSVVIPSYNSFRTIHRTIDSLLAQTPVRPEEIIVVDSSDDAKTRELLKKYQASPVRTIFLGQQTMPAIGRNVGAREAKGRILAFIDSDAYANPDWIEKILLASEKGCRVGGGAILLPPEQRERALALVQYFLQFNEFMGGALRRVVRFAPSCNLFCERKLFEEVGGFPEIRAAEDVLFGLSVSKVTPFYFDPAIRVWHIFSETWERCRTNQVLLGEYMLAYRKVYFQTWFYQGIWPLLFLPAYIALKFIRIVNRVSRFEDKALRWSFFRHLPVFLAGLFFLAWGFAGACFKKWKY